MAKRLLRVNEALRETLSQAIGEGLKDPRVGFVTVTGVETSPDLRHAKVFVSVLGGKKEREQTLAGLASSHGYLQARIAAARAPQAHAAARVPLRRLDRHAACASRSCSSATKASSDPRAGKRPTADSEGETGNEGGIEPERRERGRGMSLDPAALAAVAARMRGERLVALAVHENPDLDAVGAAVGMADLFAQLGVPARVHVTPGVELPLAAELAPDGLVTTDPVPAGATLYALDTGSRRRMALSLDGWDGAIVNIDHHHDNERFGALDLVDGESSSTSEIVAELAGELGLRPGPAAATALYAGISFDTGHFQHASTSARTFAVAAGLVQDGAEPNRVYRLLYEGRSLAVAASVGPGGGGRARRSATGARS